MATTSTEQMSLSEIELRDKLREKIADMTYEIGALVDWRAEGTSEMLVAWRLLWVTAALLQDGVIEDTPLHTRGWDASPQCVKYILEDLEHILTKKRNTQ